MSFFDDLPDIATVPQLIRILEWECGSIPPRRKGQGYGAHIRELRDHLRAIRNAEVAS
jgi:hypothetical protein